MSRPNAGQRWSNYWLGATHLAARVNLFRLVFFGLLAFDMWMLMVPHAARHANGGFNVSHLPWLDAWLPAPTAAIIGPLYVVGGFLALRIALGISIRSSLIWLTIIYNVAYWWSQSDSYQHHYLIGLLLILCCFVPFDQAREAATKTSTSGSDGPRVHSWAFVLMSVQVSIVYLFTAITKTDPAWLDGWALEQIIVRPWVREMLLGIAETMSWESSTPFAIVAIGIMAWQFLVAAALLFPRLRPLACITGPLFHVGVEVIGLKIGWFSYYMIGIYYILLFPDAWFVWLAGPVRRWVEAARAWTRRIWAAEPLARWVAMVVAITTTAVAAFVASHLPMDGVIDATLAIGALVLFSLWPRWTGSSTDVVRRAGIQVVVIAAMMLSLLGTSAMFDYHRFWGGDAARRGALEEAAEHYHLANELGPEDGPARYGKLALVQERLGQRDAAIANYRRCLARQPDSRVCAQGLLRLAARAQTR